MKTLHIFHHSNLLNGVDQTTLTLVRGLQRMGGQVAALVPQVGDVTRALEECGIRYRVSDLPCCTGPAKMAELRYLSRAASRAEELSVWLREERFDLVHLNTGHLLDGAVAAAQSGTPAIWHIHAPFDVDYARYAGVMPIDGYAWLIGALGSHVLAVSEDIRQSITKHLPPDCVTTLFNGIDIEDLDRRARLSVRSIQQELNLVANTPIVLGVGRISEQKDFATFIRVAAQVIEANHEVCFVIAGPAEDDTLAMNLVAQIKALHLEKRVFLLGPRADVPSLLSQCSMFLSTAIFEGQGLAALEAMALRRPVVAMACVGLRECINDEQDGLLVDLGDEQACARAVTRVLTDTALAERLGKAGRVSVERRFSADAYARDFHAIAQEVLEAPNFADPRAAEFTLGLLRNIREAHERLILAGEPKSLRARLRRKFEGLITPRNR